MKYFVRVGEETHEVDLVERLGELEVRYAGEPLDVRYEEADRLGQVALAIEGRAYAVSIEGDAHSAAVTVAGHLYVVEIEDERERAASVATQSRGGGGPVKSVMPGVVVKLLIAEGDEVQAGQALLILEAMKMQNEITAPAAGRVSTIHVTEGVAVGSGQPLVTLDEP